MFDNYLVDEYGNLPYAIGTRVRVSYQNCCEEYEGIIGTIIECKRDGNFPGWYYSLKLKKPLILAGKRVDTIEVIHFELDALAEPGIDGEVRIVDAELKKSELNVGLPREYLAGMDMDVVTTIKRF